MAGAYRGEAKTDARDAYVIAETARLRRDFAPPSRCPRTRLLTWLCSRHTAPT
ncbi:transposase [Streptomyces sp. NPDC101169]|uniref:IS110 family transposase n=1 Tax=Streptomyces sp. NPDC101169 TaxID=3366121 RepID=UPI0037FE463A